MRALPIGRISGGRGSALKFTLKPFASNLFKQGRWVVSGATGNLRARMWETVPACRSLALLSVGDARLAATKTPLDRASATSALRSGLRWELVRSRWLNVFVKPGP